VSTIRWRWEERDFGFRFRIHQGRGMTEHYQAARQNELYIVPPSQRKLDSARIKELAEGVQIPSSFETVANPWQNYERDWDWIQTEDGMCFNNAGCLDREEIERREDEGVGRAMEYVAALVLRPEPVLLTLPFIRNIHQEFMGAIYPFAGNWRAVSLHKGDGPTKWPLPFGGIQAVMEVFERDVLSRSPFISEVDDEVYAYASEVMNEILAIHPFREGNGRAAFIIGNLILMQNDFLPLDVYDRKRDEKRYFEASEAGRIQRDYTPLAALITEWEQRAIERWEALHGT
jgi:cell filamentation protein